MDQEVKEREFLSRTRRSKVMDNEIVDDLTKTQVLYRIGTEKYGNVKRAVWKLKCGVCGEQFWRNTQQIRRSQKSNKDFTCGECPPSKVADFILTNDVTLKL